MEGLFPICDSDIVILKCTSSVYEVGSTGFSNDGIRRELAEQRVHLLSLEY